MTESKKNILKVHPKLDYYMISWEGEPLWIKKDTYEELDKMDHNSRQAAIRCLLMEEGIIDEISGNLTI